MLTITYCGPPSASGRQPMPTFCVRPKKLPLGSWRSISAVSGRRPSGPSPSMRDVSIVCGRTEHLLERRRVPVGHERCDDHRTANRSRRMS